MPIAEDLQTLKTNEQALVSNKVARFAYTQRAYDNNLVASQTDYDYNRDMNVPQGTASIMRVNQTIIDKGWRAQASSLTRMLMNHFLGRLSYNVNKIHDNFLSFITSMQESLGSANGIATLDSTGRLPASQLPLDSIEYKGTWNAETNTPALADGTGTLGDMYIVSVAGTQNLGSGNIIFSVDDRVLYNGSVWQKISGGAVKSVNGVSPDYTTGNIEITGSNIDTSSSDSTKIAISLERLLSDLAPAFSVSTSYSVGDYVIYSKVLYKCTTAHTAGAWNSSHFTAVTVGNELNAKADKATTVNGHALSANVTITKSELGLEKVVNTGDSAFPEANGTKKFTSGGAYNFFGKCTDPDVWLGKVFSWTSGKVWTQGTGIYSRTFNTIYYANGIWVAGSDSYGLWWSTDGKAWTEGMGYSLFGVYSVHYANGIWVAGSGSHGLWWSTDGKAWTRGTGSNTSYTFNAIYYANGIWVAGSGSHGLWWSTDGKAWTQGTGSNTSDTFYSVYYANGIWVAGSGTHGLWWSTDGKAWTQGTGSNTSYTFNSVYYANGIWVAGSYRNGLWWSTDGKAWTQGTGSNTSYEFYCVYYANGIWVAGSDIHGLWWSTDGKAWTQGTGGNTSNTFNCVYCANGVWIAGGSSYRGLWWSTDGKAWTQGTGGNTSRGFKCVYYANGIWVAGSGFYGLWWSSYTESDLQ